MPRKKRYASDAERQAAYRERRNGGSKTPVSMRVVTDSPPFGVTPSRYAEPVAYELSVLTALLLRIRAGGPDGRAAAVEYGQKLGENEAYRRKETGLKREQRVARARAYAAWEFDGKGLGVAERYRREFGIQPFAG